MKWIALALALTASACANSKYHELAHTSDSDPIWQLNVGKWTYNENTLTTPLVTEAWK